MSPTQAANSSTRDLYRQTRRAAILGLIVAISLGVAKLLGGWFGHSLALLSDSANSLGDAFSSISILGALWWAEQPADSVHPYGHSRIESIVASYVALFLIGSGICVGYEAICSWNILEPAPEWYTVVIALVCIVVNEAIFRYSLSVARSTGSKSVEASAWDKRLDVFASLVVLLGLGVTLCAGPTWHVVDHIAALIVGGVILYTGGSLFWGSLQDLMDRQASPEVLAGIRRTALTVPGVCGVDKLHVRKAGLEYFVDIHIEVDPGISVTEGHTIGHAVKDRLVSEITGVRDVLVHIEPFTNHDVENRSASRR